MAETHKKKIKTDTNPDLEALEQKILELTDALQRERADAANVRRRAEEDRLKMASFFKASVIKELLPFVDNFDRALTHMPAETTSNKQLDDWLKGLSGINKQLKQALDAIGVERIKTVGEHFDPKYHEAVQMDEGAEGANEIITEEFMSGFILDGEVIRHAMVKVSLK